MRLLVVELTRLRWRRAVLVLLVAAIGVPVFLGVVKVLEQAPPQANAYEQAVEEAEAAADDPFYDEQVQLCVDDPAGYGVGGADVQASCEELVLPSPENYLPYSLDLAREREQSGFAAAVFVGLIALLIGTTFIGHDWNTGSMSNQLLFETRRLRVWGAKAVAVTVGTGVVAAIGLTAFWLILAASFWAEGVPIGDGVLRGSLEQGFRGAGIAALAALAGFAITMLSRSTVFTLGLLLGVAVAGGLLIGFFVDDPGPVDPTINVSAVIQDGATYYIDVPESCYDGTTPEADFSGGGPCDPERVRPLDDGLGYLGVVTAVVLVASAASYRRRDVP